MADFKPTDLGFLATSTGYTQIIPAPPSGIFVIKDGGVTIQNTTTTDHTLTFEIRKGTQSVQLGPPNTIQAKEVFIWERVIRIPSDFTGIFAKFTAAPASKPSFYYTGTVDGA